MSSRLIVNSIRHTGASGDAVTLANDGTCTANITNRSNRNLIINGAMQVAQRGTSTTDANSYTADRFKVQFSGVDENPTNAQVDVAAGTTPYTLGLRKCLKVTNGNQTSGAGADDYMFIKYVVEAQDTATSGWNFKTTGSSLTLSFWVKSSVAQNFYCYIEMPDSPEQVYPFETGNLSADTWTKVTKTIPGNSNIVVNNDTGEGLKLFINQFWGTSFTDSGRNLNTWGGFSSAARMPDFTSTWYTTNDATFEITGVQLEVGSVATDFEHRSYGDELARCYRYYQRIDGSSTNTIFGVGNVDGANQGQVLVTLGTPLRAKASSMDTTGSSGDYKFRVTTTQGCDAVPTLHQGGFTQQFLEWHANGHGFTSGQAALGIAGNSSAFLGFSAEL